MVILDLHWTDDDSGNAPMAKKSATVSAVQFWDEVAATFGSNSLVFYELCVENGFGDHGLFVYFGAGFASGLALPSCLHRDVPCDVPRDLGDGTRHCRC